jgi:hypothetical protein
MPVLGALKAEGGRVGRDFGPLLRTPTPGEAGGFVLVTVAIIAEVRWNWLAVSTASPL